MILNNYKYLRIYAETVDVSSQTLTTQMKDFDGNNVTYYPYVANQSSGLNATYANRIIKHNIYAVLGKGNTEPTIDDYRLSDSIMGNLSNVSITQNTEIIDVDGKPATKITLNIIGYNNTSNDISVSEYGITAHVFYSSSSASQYKDVLLSRDVLSTPIVLEAGKGFALTITWTEE